MLDSFSAMHEEPTDLGRPCFRNMDPETREIALKYYENFSMNDIGEINGCRWQWRGPDRYEPRIPFDLVADTSFERADFTHMIIAHSPTYTSPEADELLPTIRRHMRNMTP